MRILRINGEICDIDEKTAIGIDFQCYDISDPSNQKTTVSNKFTIPKTAKNLRLIKFTGNPHSVDDFAYNQNIVDYWTDSIQLIKSGTFYISEINDRINIIISEKNSIWQNLALLKWNQFLFDFMEWAKINYPAVGTIESPNTHDTFQNIITSLANENATPFVLPAFISNLALYDDESTILKEFVETENKIYLKYCPSNASIKAQGGHFCVYIKYIFKYIESVYNISFGTTSIDLDTIFNDEIASQMYIPARRINLRLQKHSTANYNWFFEYDELYDFLPEETLEDKEDKTLFDFVKAFFQHFNLIMKKESDNSFLLYRFDKLRTSTIVDFSSKIKEVSIFTPILPNYKQTNYIKWASVADKSSDLINSKKITCSNFNIDKGGEGSLFTIDGFIPNVTNGGFLYLAESDSFNTFEFLIHSNNQVYLTVNSFATDINIDWVEETTCNVSLFKSALYNLENEYTFLSEIVNKPKKYTIKKYLSLLEINNLSFINRYRIIHKDINGLFFILKVSGYNPDKSNEPTTIELLKL
jgi:hypothetical protein